MDKYRARWRARFHGRDKYRLYRPGQQSGFQTGSEPGDFILCLGATRYSVRLGLPVWSPPQRPKLCDYVVPNSLGGI
uniref:Uncharacterized protein n=1 Tax=uncultured marine virus TaxID=186617 RepID=A0A0F7L3Q6_9VIRU|nr:hypothetical protein [uncultured marine virus]